MSTYTLVPIVEGDGEVEAVPILLRRLFESYYRYDWKIAPVKNAHSCSNLIKPKGLENFLEYARREPNCSAILVLLDADEKCASSLACELGKRAQTLNLLCPVAIVCAKCEYEAWFLASLETIKGQSLKGRPGIVADAHYDPQRVEQMRGVKEWLTDHMPPGRAYKETQDQASMTQLMDFALAREWSRSFRRLEHAFEQLLAAVDGETSHFVTPLPLSE